MSNIDKHALRKLAVDAKELAIIKRYTKGIEAQKKFIAEMTPATVLALLDELEAKDKQIAEFELAQSLYDEGASMLCGQFDELAAAMGWTSELAEKQGVSQLEYARGLKRRIAELEARDKPKFLQCWSCKHDIEVLAIADCDGYCPRCAAQIDLDDEPYAAAGKGE